ncbi:MBL fold metallo-hydrolase [Acholeplasma equirhinis]|uniref:MBL fold metallo-hydrolase n=1 Tax=Acholeplasma equirhinis TaxID=555393 RepID=UPI00197AEDAC|nr:MBL fold metallo-hydrolase [Acholeplasma equirhinis]MBN3490430.1 MBL fold metallo-hydrolase [Acholeplasma equirhinis]
MNKIIDLPIPFGQGMVHLMLLQDDTNVILVDSGPIGSIDLISDALNKHQLSIDKLTGLVLTHHDHDHVGSAAKIKLANPKIKVYASEIESIWITKKEKPLRQQQAESTLHLVPDSEKEFAHRFISILESLEPVNVDYYLNDGEILPWCGGVKVISTPGHTPGHISIEIINENVVISGDAIVLENHLPAIANPSFTFNMEDAVKSFDKLMKMDVKTYYCYHGGMYKKS